MCKGRRGEMEHGADQNPKLLRGGGVLTLQAKFPTKIFLSSSGALGAQKNRVCQSICQQVRSLNLACGFLYTYATA